VNAGPDEDCWRVDAPIGKVNKFRYGVTIPGKPAVTDFSVITIGAGAALIEARPLTGRTHQIRVHLAHSGLPIAGDETYGGTPAKRMHLHCRSMAFTDKKGLMIRAEADVDDSFRDFAASCRIDLPQ
jgi:23S rRNA-/tRNA-specific pseudouridylate synthase